MEANMMEQTFPIFVSLVVSKQKLSIEYLRRGGGLFSDLHFHNSCLGSANKGIQAQVSVISQFNINKPIQKLYVIFEDLFSKKGTV